MKCPICNLTLADPPNGEEEDGCQGLSGSRPEYVAATPAANSETANIAVAEHPQTQPTTPPYRAEVIDNAVIALSGGIKL